VNYSYDAASRLETVTSGTNTATYSYLPNSPLISSVTFKNGTSTRLVTAKSYDNLNRLGSISNSPSASSAQSVNYRYNSANQRTRATREDSAYWRYEYDALGQVTAGRKHLPTDTIINGMDYAWTFDDIGNRKTATANSQVSNYTANLLNQYDSRTVPGVVDIMGAAQPDAKVTVTVGSGLPQPTTRQGDFFFKQATVDNSSAAKYVPVTVTGVKNLVGPNQEDAVTEETRPIFVPAAQETYGHDADGNLTSNAKWDFTWDGENRLIKAETSSVALAAGAPKKKLEFVYDGQSRRISKQVFDWSIVSGQWSLVSSLRFVYDGWNLVAEIDDSGIAIRTHVWGLDLSGTIQGAGGVGGLLFTSDTASTHCAAFDGNGNLLGLIDSATGTRTGRFDYNAFGQTVVSEGSAASLPFRFSTKYHDDEIGLISYIFRPYDPETGRWLSKDPIEETGGTSLYGFVGNNGVSAIDILGREAALDVWFLTVIEGGKSAGPTIAGAGAGTVATAVVVSAALVVTPMDQIIGPPRTLPYDPRDVRPGGPGPINPEFRDPNSPRPRFPSIQPTAIADLLPREVPGIYFTPFGPDKRTRCAPCLAIIGETFRPRVLAAKAMYPSAETFEPPEGIELVGVIAAENVRWIQGVMRRNCTIIDIGYDSDRGGPGQRARGIYYPLELYASAGYLNKIFQQFPGSGFYNKSLSK